MRANVIGRRKLWVSNLRVECSRRSALKGVVRVNKPRTAFSGRTFGANRIRPGILIKDSESMYPAI